MSASLQVLYPSQDGSTFDFEYYLSTHMDLVQEHMGAFIEKTLVTKGIAGGPDVPPPFQAIATIIFKSGDAMAEAMKVSGPVMGDVPNFTNIRPTVLIGEAVG